MWKVKNTVITDALADAIYDKASNDWTISAMESMMIRDYGVDPEDVEDVLKAVLEIMP